MRDEDGTGARERVGPLLRRIRRLADLSQRELARALGISTSAVGQAETGARDLPATVLARAAGLAGLRLVLLDGDGREVAGMAEDAVRDDAGRRYPAHLDVRYGDDGWWHGPERYTRQQPWYTFDRSRPLRDEWRRATGTPVDHQRPRPGDSPGERAQSRAREAWAARARERAARAAARARDGDQAPFTVDCSCPPDCDQLLFPVAPLPPRQQAVPHVDECGCRCDVA